MAKVLVMALGFVTFGAWAQESKLSVEQHQICAQQAEAKVRADHSPAFKSGDQDLRFITNIECTPKVTKSRNTPYVNCIIETFASADQPELKFGVALTTDCAYALLSGIVPSR